VQHHANSAYYTSTQTDLFSYLHAACGSPVPSIWIKAINNGHFATWPGLTAKLVREKLPKSIATVKGHLNRQRKNIRSTQPRAIKTDADEDSDYLDDISPAFPSISDGTYPKQISDPRGFPSPSSICATHFYGVFTVTRSFP
jgi:hypothetical protein